MPFDLFQVFVPEILQHLRVLRSETWPWREDKNTFLTRFIAMIHVKGTVYSWLKVFETKGCSFVCNFYRKGFYSKQRRSFRYQFCRTLWKIKSVRWEIFSALEIEI